jgi:hypothetical protein
VQFEVLLEYRLVQKVIQFDILSLRKSCAVTRQKMSLSSDLLQRAMDHVTALSGGGYLDNTVRIVMLSLQEIFLIIVESKELRLVLS